MRILHTESSVNWGGQEVRTLEQMRWLGDHGHQVLMAARPGCEVERRALDAGLNVVQVPFSGHYSPPAVLAARRLVRAHAIEVADCHGSRDGDTFAFVRDLCAVVRTRHITQPLKGKWHRRLLWRHGCHHVIANAHCIADGLLGAGLATADRITVIGEWAADDFFDNAERQAHRDPVRDEFGVPPERPLVTVIGMLRDDKGQDHFIRIVAEMRRRARPVTGLIVGSATQPDYERRLGDLVAEYGLADDIVFAGYRDDIPRLTQASDVLVITSELEAQSRTAPQAFASGTPVVAHRVGGIPELVVHGETGWLTEAGDTGGFADALCAIVDRPLETRRMTDRARDFADTNLRMDGKMEETMRVYETAVTSWKRNLI